MASVMTEWRKKNPEKAKASRQRYEADNRDELNRKRREYRKENPDITRNQWYKQQYGISLDEYQELLDKQHSRCALCHKLSWECRRRLVVDHDHETGEVRALLCTGCNILVGFMEKKGRLVVEKALKYIDDYRERVNLSRAS
jgi:hypothetical protein